MGYFNKNLKENEEVIRLIRRHWLSFWPQSLLTILVFLLPFVLIFLLFSWGKTGLWIFLLLLFIGLLTLVRLIVVYYYNVFLVTDQRVILFKQKGLFDRYVSEIEYPKIQDVSYHFKGIFQTVFHYGSLKIQILSSETIIKPENIPQPQKVQDLIKSIRKNFDLKETEKPAVRRPSRLDDIARRSVR